MSVLSSSRVPLGAQLAAAVVGAVPAAFLQFGSREPLGFDGYYYVSQVSTLLSKWQFHYPTPNAGSIILLALLSAPFHNPVVGIKIAVVLLSSASALLVFHCSYRISPHPSTALVSAVLLSVSASYAQFLTEFTANLIGVTVFLCGVLLYLSEGLGPATAAGGLVLLSVFHRSTAMLWLAVIIFHVLIGRRTAWWRSGEGDRGAAWAIPAISLLVILIVSLPQFLQLPGVILRLSMELSAVPGLRIFENQPLRFQQLLIWIVAVGVWKHWAQAESPPTCVNRSLVLIAAAAAVTANPWANYQDQMDLFCVRLGLCGIAVLAIVGPAAVRWTRRSAFWRFAAPVAMVVLLHAGKPPDGASARYLMRRAEIIDAACLALARGSAPPIIMAQHGYEFGLTARCGVRAMSRPPVPDAFRNSAVWLINMEGAVDDPVVKAAALVDKWVLIDAEELRRFAEHLSPEEVTRIETQSRVHFPDNRMNPR